MPRKLTPKVPAKDSLPLGTPGSQAEGASVYLQTGSSKGRGGLVNAAGFLGHCTFIHILYFGIFQSRTGRDRVGQRLRREGEGGWLPFPSHPSWPRHTGSTHKGAGEAQKPPWWRRRHKATPMPHTHTHTRPPTPTHTHEQARSTPGRRDHREAERCGVKGREAPVPGGAPLQSRQKETEALRVSAGGTFG